jgi:hypothetical protein
MATPSNPMAVGGYVQYNPTTQNPLSPAPTAAEETLGIVRQLFTAQGKQFAQVVWNPGSTRPETGLYTCDQLTAIDQKTATDIINQMNAGTYTPNLGTPSSNFTQPSVPALALPPGQQGEQVTPNITGPITGPLSPGTGYK